jgi:hypothetical protein
LHAYCQWLKSRPAYEREELLDLEPSKRIERIRELRAEEAKRPKRKDMEGLRRWMQEFAAQPEHQEEIFKAQEEIFKAQEENLKAMLKEGGPRATEMIGRWKKWIDGMKEKSDTRRYFAVWAMRMQMYRPGKPDWLTDDDLADLRKHFLDETSAKLAAIPPAEQWEIIRGWFRPPRGRPFSSRRFQGGPPPKEVQEKLDHFFEHELTPEEQAKLLNLPGDEMQERLRRMYFGRIWGMRGPGLGSRRPGPPGPARSHSGRPGRGPREKTPRQNGRSRDR